MIGGGSARSSPPPTECMEVCNQGIENTYQSEFHFKSISSSKKEEMEKVDAKATTTTGAVADAHHTDANHASLLHTASLPTNYTYAAIFLASIALYS